MEKDIDAKNSYSNHLPDNTVIGGVHVRDVADAAETGTTEERSASVAKLLGEVHDWRDRAHLLEKVEQLNLREKTWNDGLSFHESDSPDGKRAEMTLLWDNPGSNYNIFLEFLAGDPEAQILYHEVVAKDTGKSRVLTPSDWRARTDQDEQ